MNGTSQSNSVTIANTAPIATVSLNTSTPKTNDTLTATATKSDNDGDTVTLTYVWKVNGTIKKTTSGSSSLTDTFDLSVAGNGDRGDVITVEVTPNDGTVDGTMVSDTSTVQNSAPTCSNVPITVSEDGPAGTTAPSCSDPDTGETDTLIYTKVTDPAHGTGAFIWSLNGTWNPIGSCTNLTPVPVTTGVGMVSCTWQDTLPTNSNGETYNIKVVVNNYYVGETQTVINIAIPNVTNFTTGGGYLVLTSPIGPANATVGSKMNFGFNFKYNKSGTNPQGKATIILRTATGLYQIKTNSITSFQVVPAPFNYSRNGTAVVVARANVTDLSTGLSAPGGPFNVKLQMTDAGEPGAGQNAAPDTFAVSVFQSNGGLWFGSNWTGSRVIEQLLGGGNLQVH